MVDRVSVLAAINALDELTAVARLSLALSADGPTIEWIESSRFLPNADTAELTVRRYLEKLGMEVDAYRLNAELAAVTMAGSDLLLSRSFGELDEPDYASKVQLCGSFPRLSAEPAVAASEIESLKLALEIAVEKLTGHVDRLKVVLEQSQKAGREPNVAEGGGTGDVQTAAGQGPMIAGVFAGKMEPDPNLPDLPAVEPRQALARGANGTSAKIPLEYRSCAMSKRKAAGYLRPGNPDSAVEWLSKCIDDGTIHCETLSRQSHVFDVREFPVEAQQACGEQRPTFPIMPSKRRQALASAGKCLETLFASPIIAPSAASLRRNTLHGAPSDGRN